MSLIPCPDCQTRVSTRALACPKCGCPIANEIRPAIAPEIKRPALPEDLMVHGTDFRWSGLPDRISGKATTETTIPAWAGNDYVSVTRLKTGLTLYARKQEIINVHYSQIAAVTFLEATKQKEKKKSVLGRALIGGVLLGPLGAVVGGISGTGSDVQSFDGISITIWSLAQSQYMNLVVDSKSSHVKPFVDSICEFIKPYQNLHFETAV